MLSRKRKYFKQWFILSVSLLLISIVSCNNSPEDPAQFSVAFFTDIHLNMVDNGCFEGLNKAISIADSFGVDFILTGGDNVDIDVLKDDSATAFKLYEKYFEIIQSSPVKIFSAIGNHDRYSGARFEDPMRGSALFESFLGKSYYSNDHKNWHFITLNTVQNVNGQYAINDIQKDWLINDLNGLGKKVPIVIICHVPFLSTYTPATSDRYGFDSFSNFRDILNLFEDYNLKLVLQGHQHLYEEIKVRNVQYITGGAISASWWGGPYYRTEEGFLLLNFTENDFSWNYIDYGWEAKKPIK